MYVIYNFLLKALDIQNLGPLINVQLNNFPNVLKLYRFGQFNRNNNNEQLVQNNL